MKLLITNGDNIRALVFARAVADQTQLHISAERRFAACFFSNIPHKRTLNANPKKHPDLFLKQMIHYTRKHDIDTLIPINSDEITIILRNRNRFNCSIPYPDFRLLDRMRDKWEFYKVLKKLRIPTPFTTCDPEKAITPAIIKQPRGAGSKGMMIARTHEELKNCTQKISKDFSCRPIIQQYIEGKPYGAAAVKGEVMVYQNLRQYPVEHGTSTCRISVHNKKIESQIRKILKHLKWEGIAQFDIIERDSTYYVIEMNPRLYTSLNVTTKSGFNLPMYWLRTAKPGYRDNVISKAFFFDLYTRLRTGIPTPPGEVYYDDFDPKDPLPSIPLLVKTIRRKLL